MANAVPSVVLQADHRGGGTRSARVLTDDVHPPVECEEPAAELPGQVVGVCAVTSRSPSKST